MGCVDTTSPVGSNEILVATEFASGVQDNRNTLGSVAVLVAIGRHGSDTGNTEIENRNLVTELLNERQEETTEASIDVHTDTTLLGKSSQLLDRIDNTLGEGGQSQQ